MFRELLIMTRWRVFDSILHHVRAFRASRHDKLKTIGKIAFWGVVLMLVLHALSKHRD